MSIVNSNSYSCQVARHRNKTVDQQMKQAAVEGTGLSPWEADVLIKVISDVYFNDIQQTIKPGQVLYNCVSAKEGAGKPLKECAMEMVLLSLFEESDKKGLEVAGKKHRQTIVRQRRLMRLCEQARDQGGLLTHEDLAQLLMCDSKSIQRDVKELQALGIIVPTRGRVKDIGPGITHRELIIRHWLEGKEELEICRCTKHSMTSVENYLKAFKRVVFLRIEKKFTDHEISVAAGVSQRAVGIYLDVYGSLKNKGIANYRMAEICHVGDQYYKETGEKKDSQRVNTSKQEWRVK
ncbi:MAG: DUF1670 domain-containing protein [Kiritimatiellae bacterium]|nr:DUF1670 domain-containing protein [Kiritimatiellia bacterium]